MPYIKQDKRIVESTEFQDFPMEVAGDLNYLFTKIAHRYLKKNGICYQHFNDVVGALEGCKLELVRRFVNEYEDECIERNGDVKELGGSF